MRSRSVSSIGVDVVVTADLGARRQFGGGGEDRREDVGVVVRRLALQDRRDALEAHPGIDVARRKRDERAVGLRVVLHEHVVPDLHHPRIVLVDERGAIGRRALVVGAEVDVDLGARAARAGVAHHPEVVLRRSVEDVLGDEAGLRRPDLRRLVVAPEAEPRVAAVDGHVEAIGRHAPALGQQLPRPRDRLGFEVVAERPVAEHFEQRVVVRVVPDFFEVVVLAAHAEAELRVGDARRDRRSGAEENVLEGRHATVHEQERRVARLRHERRRRHDGVAALAEEVEEVLPERRSGVRNGRGRGGRERSGHRRKSESAGKLHRCLSALRGIGGEATARNGSAFE